MISKDIMSGFRKGNQLMMLSFKPDPQGKSRFIPSNKRLEKIDRSSVSHIQEEGEDFKPVTWGDRNPKPSPETGQSKKNHHLMFMKKL